MAKATDVMIPAIIERANPDLTEYKIFNATLTFNGRLSVLVPVPAEQVEVHKGKDGDTYTLTLDGWKSFLKAYTKITQQLQLELFR